MSDELAPRPQPPATTVPGFTMPDLGPGEVIVRVELSADWRDVWDLTGAGHIEVGRAEGRIETKQPGPFPQSVIERVYVHGREVERTLRRNVEPFGPW